MTDFIFAYTPGEPVPQGSLRSAGNGRLYYSNAAKLKPARAALTAAIEGAMAAKGHTTWVCPIRVEVEFRHNRPKSHYRTNGELKPTASEYKITPGDVDKQLRLVLDACTDSRVFHDDSMVVDAIARKRYATQTRPTGTYVKISPIEE